MHKEWEALGRMLLERKLAQCTERLPRCHGGREVMSKDEAVQQLLDSARYYVRKGQEPWVGIAEQLEAIDAAQESLHPSPADAKVGAVEVTDAGVQAAHDAFWALHSTNGLASMRAALEAYEQQRGREG